MFYRVLDALEALLPIGRQCHPPSPCQPSPVGAAASGWELRSSRPGPQGPPRSSGLDVNEPAKCAGDGGQKSLRVLKRRAPSGVSAVERASRAQVSLKSRSGLGRSLAARLGCAWSRRVAKGLALRVRASLNAGASLNLNPTVHEMCQRI